MEWLKIEFTGDLAETQADWFRAAFLQVAWGLPDKTTDHMALYWGRTDAQEPVFYLSPLAAEALTAAMPNYNLAPCERPGAGLFVAFGGYQADDPAWFDLPAEAREQDLAETRLTPDEAAIEYQGC